MNESGNELDEDSFGSEGRLFDDLLCSKLRIRSGQAALDQFLSSSPMRFSGMLYNTVA